jgi:YD repeat-containing protein
MASVLSRARGLLLCALASTVSSAATTTYEYDALGRLRVVTHDNRIVTTYTLDPAGNRTRVTDAAVVPASAPSSISVPTSSTSGAYAISWGSSTGTVSAYELYESTSASFSDSTRVHNAATQSASFVGKASQTTYYYRVRACGVGGCSAFTAGANGVAVNLPPPAPAAPTNLTKTFVANCAWRATWSAVSGAANYVLRDTVGNQQTVVTTTAHVSCPLNNQNANQPRWVKACNSAGVCSAAAYFQ